MTSPTHHALIARAGRFPIELEYCATQFDFEIEISKSAATAMRKHGVRLDLRTGEMLRKDGT